MVHLTDSALPPAHLAHLAESIRRERLPPRWHWFVRAEPEFGEPAFGRALAEGGCALFQFGMETASPRPLCSARVPAPRTRAARCGRRWPAEP